jgi:DNA-binding NarL/FixJ family response regulator
MARGSVLIVEDDHEFASTVSAPYFSRRWSVVFARDLPEAHAALGQVEDLRLALVDLDVPAGPDAMPLIQGSHGFEIVSRIRSERPEAWVVILTDCLDDELVNTGQRLGADYVSKWRCQENLRTVAKRLKAREETRRSPLLSAAELIRRKHALSKRQAQILELAVLGRDRAEIAHELRISVSSVKTHVRALLHKCRKRSLRALTRDVYRAL